MASTTGSGSNGSRRVLCGFGGEKHQTDAPHGACIADIFCVEQSTSMVNHSLTLIMHEGQELTWLLGVACCSSLPPQLFPDGEADRDTAAHAT